MPDMSTSVTLSSFDPALVGLSFLISVFGAWCGLNCATRARRSEGLAAVGWLLGAAVALGGGAIWSMHFIGMLAFQGHVIYRLDQGRTALSLAAAVVASLFGLTIASRVRNKIGYVVGGLVLGAGIGAMHYLGMQAMQMNASMSYKPLTVVLSLVIAAAGAIVALVFALNVERTWVTALASLVLGVGVCTMHYTGMFALELDPDVAHVDLDLVTRGTDPFSLAMPIFGITALLLFVLLFAGIFGARQDEPEAEPAVQPAV
jgi:NO-binding membrane sensor protein with MHYT domain